METNQVSKEENGRMVLGNAKPHGDPEGVQRNETMNQKPASARPGRRKDNPNSKGSTMVRGHWVVPGTSMTRSAYVGPDPEEETQRK